MKKIFTTFATTLAIGTAVLIPALAETGVVAPVTGSNNNWGCPISNDFATNGSEMLYTASQLANATGGLETFSISSISFEQSQSQDGYDVPIRVYYATTDKTNLLVGLDESELTMVYEGVVPYIGKGTMTIDLDTKIVMNAGENLVLAFKTEKAAGAWYPAWSQGDGEDNCSRSYVSWSGPVTLTADGGDLSGKAPALSITYSEGEGDDTPVEPDVYDLEATSISGPAEVLAGSPYTFNVNVTNAGNQAIESYNVTVATVNANGEETPVGSVEDCARLIKGASATVPVEVTITEPGTYNVVARVFTDPDSNYGNDVCEPIEVKALRLDIKAGAITAPESVELDEEFNVEITVANAGADAGKGYTVELVSLDAAGKVIKTLAEVTDVPEIAANSEVIVKVPATFTLAGEYRLQGVVTVPGFDATKTEIAEVSATYDKLPGVHNVTAPKDVSTIAVNKFFTREGRKSISQFVYTPDMLNAIERDAQIQSMTFTLVDPEYKTTIPATVAVASVADVTSLTKSTPVNPDKFVTVYEGEIAWTPTVEDVDVTLEFGRNFTLVKGESLVVMVTTSNEDPTDGDWAPEIKCGQMSSTMSIYSTTGRYGSAESAEALTIYPQANDQFYYLPIMKFGYALEPLPDMVDLELSNVVIPTEAEAGVEITVKADVRNNGTVAADTYSLELLNVADAENPVVLATKDIDDSLGAGGEAFNQKIKYTFNDPGTYEVAVRVVAEGDADNSNNISNTEIVTVTGNENGISGVASDAAIIRCVNGVVTMPTSAVSAQVADLAGRVVATGTSAVRLEAGIYVITAKLADGRVAKSRVVVK